MAKEQSEYETEERFYGFTVYGDNLEECHKLCEILARFGMSFGFELKSKIGPIDQPVYIFEFSFDDADSEQVKVGLAPCGRYQDWEREKRPKIGIEDPDIILCPYERNKIGDPILAAEFNDAIPAGNNAWQRFPRTAQAAEHGIPFIYIIPVADAEVKDGVFRSLRHPNVIFQLAQFNLMQKYGVYSVTIYRNSPWYAGALREGKACPDISVGLWGKSLSKLLVAEILGIIFKSENGCWDYSSISRIKEEGFKESAENMLRYISEFASSDFKMLENHPILKSERTEVIEAWWEKLESGKDIDPKYLFFDWSREDFLEAEIPFDKRLSTTSKYKEIINPKLTSPLAFSYKEGANEIAIISKPKEFAKILARTYSLEKEIKKYLFEMDGTVLFMPIAGYVQDTGGPSFSRPDKGLVRLIEETFCTNDVFDSKIVLLYSQLVPNDWKDQIRIAQREKRQKLSGTNNLWRELVRWADLIIADVYEEGILL